MTDIERIELAIRRTSDRLKGQVPWDVAVTEALDDLADELAGMREESFIIAPDGFDMRPGAINRLDEEQSRRLAQGERPALMLK